MLVQCIVHHDAWARLEVTLGITDKAALVRGAVQRVGTWAAISVQDKGRASDA
jgi:hypothetical protein